jgi:hypothetical protein
MEQLWDRERDRYGRIFRNLITLYVVHTNIVVREEADRPWHRIAELASLLRANP